MTSAGRQDDDSGGLQHAVGEQVNGQSGSCIHSAIVWQQLTGQRTTQPQGWESLPGPLGQPVLQLSASTCCSVQSMPGTLYRIAG